MKRSIEAGLAAVLALLMAAARAQDSGAAATPAATPPATNGNGNGNLSATKQELSRMPSAAKLRPTGPVTIKSNSSEMEQNNFAVYTGNVILDSDTLKMDGDRLELKRTADGQYTVKVTGAPAHMFHPGTDFDDPPMKAHAKTMTYDSRTTVIDLVGEALMTKGEDTTTADTIHYNLSDEHYEASGGSNGGGGNGRVTVVIPQAPVAGGATPQAPAPAPAQDKPKP